MQKSASEASLLRKTMGWMVHGYTASGLVCAAGIAALIIVGTHQAFLWAFALMFLATFIDATDGTMARAIKIKELLPGFDGRRLDDIIDFHTYTSLPLLLLWRANALPADLAWLLVLPLVASVYGFCQTKAKTDDGYFLGFPSYWNLVAFYLYMLQAPQLVSLAIVLVLALLTFVPTRYLYPSMGGKLNMFTNVLGGIWGILLIWILGTTQDVIAIPGDTKTLTYVSLFFPVWYMVASFWIEISIRLGFTKTKEKGDVQLDAVIWDMDGTLVYSEQLHLCAYQEVLKPYGFSLDEKEYDQFTGATDAMICEYLIKKHSLPITTQALLQSKETELAKLIKTQVKLAPGVIAKLDHFRKEGLKMAVASSSLLSTIEAILDAVGIRDYFTVIASGEEVAKSKPAPDVFLLAAKRLGVKPEFCLVIEDSTNGIKGAKAAGMTCIAVRNPWNQHQDHSAADVCVAGFDQMRLMPVD